MTSDPWGQFKQQVVQQLEQALSKLKFQPPQPVEKTLEIPPDPKLGDLATTLCFELAKSLHKAPSWIASELTKHLKTGGLITKIEVANNYLNFFVDVPALASKLWSPSRSSTIATAIKNRNAKKS